MITTVTGGTVSVEDGVKASEDYAPARKVRVDLNFAVPEGGSAAPVLDAVSILANEKVDQLLRRIVMRVQPGQVALPGEEAQTPPKTRAKKADAPKEAAPPADDAAAIVDDDLTSSAAPADPSAVVDDDLTSSAPVVSISDADLNAAVQKKNGELKQPPLIRALIGSFSPDPTKAFQLAQIPQAQRQDFLDKLAALTAPA